MPQTARTATLITLIALAAGLNASAASLPPCHAYTHHAGTFVQMGKWANRQVGKWANGQMGEFADLQICRFADLPSSWHILTVLYTDLTYDGVRECVLLVWRPWQDWPIMQWSDTSSPIAANRDARGDSAHIILIELTADHRPLTTDHRPATTEDGLPSSVLRPSSNYRELWAGSALAVPIVQIAAGDVDGDGRNELVALEGDYGTGRYGPARHVAVWRWNGFGFTLEWRGPPGRLAALALADLDGDGVLEILVSGQMDK